MVRKKFIDKKTAHRFHLVHRSQQDPRYHAEGGSKLILTPADYKTAKALQEMGVEGVGGYDDNVGTYLDPDDVAAETSVKAKRVRAKGEVDEYGMPIDGYDYAKHMGEMGGGVYITKTGQVAAKPLPEAAMEKMRAETAAAAAKRQQQKLNLPDGVLASEEEYDRQLESITLREEHMDEDLRLALEEAEYGDDGEEEHNAVEDLDDDFMSQLAIANEEQQQQEAADAAAAAAAGKPSAGAFDFEAHMERLMLEAEREDAERFGNDSEEEGEQEQVLLGRGDMDKHFDRVFEEEYDDEELMGELYEETEDPDVGGEMELDSDRVAEVLAMHMEAINIEDEEGKGILGVGRAPRLAVLKTRTVEEQGGEEETGEDDEYEEEEEAHIEAWGEYAATTNVRPTWDCESIISTYSIVDNHPSRISLDGSNANSEGKRRSTSRFGGGVSNAPTALQSSVIREDAVLEEEEEEEEEQEEDSEGGDDPANDNDDGYSVATLLSSVKRAGKESAEEKRQRKHAVKEERRMRRMEKKSTKDEFKTEISRQKLSSIVAKGDIKAGISTFKL